MAKETQTVEIPASVRPVLLAVAKNLLHHLYGPQGPPWGTSFAALEELMVQLSDTLSSELLHQALQRQAEQPVPEPLQHCPSCGRPAAERDPEPRSVHARLGTADWKEPSSHCEHCRKAFFPQSKSLGIDLGGFSPGVLQKIVYAGSNRPSFQRGSQDLLVLAEVRVDAKQVERLTERIGKERQDERDQTVAAYLARPLAQREDPPPQVTPPQLAVVEMDGGRLQIRTAKSQPDEPAAVCAARPEGQPQATPSAASAADRPATPPPELDREADRPARSKHWREDKVGCLLEMTSAVSAVDPCPEIPAVFVDPLHSLKLAQEIGHCGVPKGAAFQAAKPDAEDAARDERQPRPGRPAIASRRVVATRQDVHAFGPLLAAAAWSMGLFSAERQAFLADGLAENWSVYKRYFSRWTPVLDFLHALTYVYAAAMAGRTFAEGWPVYERWIRWVWAGQVSRVLEELTARQQELGKATKQDKEGSPQRVVQEALTYLSNHQDKMQYDAYRQQGLPLMSSHVESTVKQLNYRVKGTEKFWAEEGAEAILQLRADYLSDDEPLEEFWQRRQEAATGQRPYRRRSA